MRERSRSLSPSPPPLSSPAVQSCSGVMQQVLSSSTVASRPERKAGLREGRWYTRSSGATDLRAAHSSSRRPPPSSAGAAKPPYTENTRLASRVKESTSAKRDTRLPPMAQSWRSMLWECCSGTIRIWGRPSPAAMASSKARVFPVPPAQQQLEYVSPPYFFGQILNYIISRPAAQSWTAGTSPLSTSLRYATINNIAIWRCGKLDAQIFWKVIGAYNMGYMGPANRPLARSPGYVRAVLHPKGTMGGKVCPRNRKLVDRSRFFRPLWIRTYPECILCFRSIALRHSVPV